MADKYRLMLAEVSTELERRDVSLDMLKFALFEFVRNRKRLDDAETAFDLFMELDSGGYISPDNLSLLNALFQLLELSVLSNIIARYGFQATDVNPSDVFSSFRISIVNMGHRLTYKNIQQIADVYRVPKENRSNQWKLMQYLYDINRLNDEEDLKKIKGIFDKYRLMLAEVSTELERRDVSLDMLKFALIEFVRDRKRLDDAKTAFDLFMELDSRGFLSPDDLILLNALFQLLGLSVLRSIIARHGYQSSNVNPSAVFSSFCISIVNMGHRLNSMNIQKIADVYRVPKENRSDQWKLMQYLYDINRLNDEEDLKKFMKIVEINKALQSQSADAQAESLSVPRLTPSFYELQGQSSSLSGFSWPSCRSMH